MRLKRAVCMAALTLCMAFSCAASPAPPPDCAEMAAQLLRAMPAGASGRWRLTLSPDGARAEAHCAGTGETIRLRWAYRDGAWQLVSVCATDG